jgi:hypothetical protein
MSALTSYLRHWIVTVIILLVAKYELPVEGSEEMAANVALIVIGTLTWAATKYAKPILKSAGVLKLLIVCLCSVVFISCVNKPDSYMVDLTGYEKQAATTPEAVLLPPEAVTPIGGTSFTFTGGAKIITDQGEIDISETGIDGTVVVDLRGK